MGVVTAGLGDLPGQNLHQSSANSHALPCHLMSDPSLTNVTELPRLSQARLRRGNSNLSCSSGLRLQEQVHSRFRALSPWQTSSLVLTVLEL